MEQPSSKALFTPAKTQRASEAIYNQIYPKIISGELRPGDRLPPERELAEMFQRSRPVVREALRMLQQEGLIETAVGSSGGAVIRGVSLKSVEEPLKNLVAMGAINLDELLEYRHINDRSCARLAAIHHTEEDAERSGRPWRARRPTWTASSVSRSMMWRSTALWPRPATTRWPL